MQHDRELVKANTHDPKVLTPSYHPSVFRVKEAAMGKGDIQEKEWSREKNVCLQGAKRERILRLLFNLIDVGQPLKPYLNWNQCRTAE